MATDFVTPLEAAEQLKAVLMAYATGQHADDAEYERLRRYFIQSDLRTALPSFVRSCRTLSEFWSVIQPRFATYRERRNFLREEFEPLISQLEGVNRAPLDSDVADALSRFDSAHVQMTWQKVMERRSNDPEGAITSARTLLETVCKHVLDHFDLSYAPGADLPELYGLAAAQLDIAPSQQTEKQMRQLLGSAQQIVQGVGAMRNSLGDSHGKGQHSVVAEARFATLAVNLAGALATFLVESFEAKTA